MQPIMQQVTQDEVDAEFLDGWAHDTIQHAVRAFPIKRLQAKIEPFDYNLARCLLSRLHRSIRESELVPNVPLEYYMTAYIIGGHTIVIDREFLEPIDLGSKLYLQNLPAASILTVTDV